MGMSFGSGSAPQDRREPGVTLAVEGMLFRSFTNKLSRPVEN